MAGSQIEAGEVGRGQILQGARLENHEEVGLEVIPVDGAQAGDPRFTVFPADGEQQMVVELELQALGHFGFHRHARNPVSGLRRPPGTCRQDVTRWQVGCPSQAQVTLSGTVATGVLADNLLHGFAIDADQAPWHHRVERRCLCLDVQQAGAKGVLVGWQDIQGEVVGRILGQLVLPGVEQFAPQQRDQPHGQQDQAKGQGLARCRQRVTQQLAQAQAPWQGGASQ